VTTFRVCIYHEYICARLISPSKHTTDFSLNSSPIMEDKCIYLLHTVPLLCCYDSFLPCNFLQLKEKNSLQLLHS